MIWTQFRLNRVWEVCQECFSFCLLVLVEFGHKLLFSQAAVLFTVARTKVAIHWMKVGLPIDTTRSLPLQDVIVLSKWKFLWSP